MRRRSAALGAAFGLLIGAMATSSLWAGDDGDGKDDRNHVDHSVAAPLILGSVDTVFVSIDPVRAFDSRLQGFPGAGILPRQSSRVVSVKDGRNLSGTVTAPDVVPPGATAISYNLTVTGATGPNYLAVTSGDATSFSASAINFGGQNDVANAGVVRIGPARNVKVWNGDQSGAAHFIVDLTGYYIERDMWAKVDADATGATLLHGHGATAVGRVAQGVFSVTFDRSVVGCGWLATRNDNLDGVSGAGEVGVELSSAADPSVLWVRTFNSSGNAVDPSSSDGFTLFVDC